MQNRLWLGVESVIGAATLTVSLTLLYFALQPVEGIVGHDYYHAVSRLNLGAVHFWQNGLRLPHYVASLCGGIPYFADPQNAYLSLIQFFTFFIDPIKATLFSSLVFYGLGYLGCLLFFGKALRYSWPAAHLGALAFVLNGFAFENLFVGHITHQPYLLAPYLLYFLFKPDQKLLVRDAILFAAIETITFYAGGLHVLVVFAVLIALVLPLKLTFSGYAHTLKLLVLSSIFFALTCSGKLLASFFYAKQFFIEPLNRSTDGVLTQVVRYFWFTPGTTPLSLPFGSLQFGIWEYVGFITKLTIPSLLFLLWRMKVTDSRRRWMFATYAILLPWICLIATGSEVNQYLPFFRHYHNPIKLLGAFLPLLVWSFAWAIEQATLSRWLTRLGSRAPYLMYFLLATLLLTEFGGYANHFITEKVGLAFPASSGFYASLKEKRRLPDVTKVVAAEGGDVAAISAGYSNLACYAPEFGYRRENLKTQATPGLTSQLRDARFNLNHPGCLLYPDFYHCQAWDRIPQSDAVAFLKFVTGDSTAWTVPLWQSALYWMNLFFFLLGVLACIVLRHRCRLKKTPLK